MNEQTQSREIWIPTAKLGTFEGRVSELNKRASRLKCSPLTYNITDETDTIHIPATQNGLSGPIIPGYDYKVTKVIVTGDNPKLNGWIVIGKLEHDNELNTNIIMEFGDNKLSAEFRHKEGCCDHCNITRQRNKTYILKNEESGEVKQIGTSCLKDFTGHSNPENACNIQSFVSDAFEDLEMLGRDSKAAGYVNIKKYLEIVAEVMIQDGYVSARKAEEELRLSTADSAMELYLNQNNIVDRIKFKISDKSIHHAQNAIDFIKNLDRDNYDSYANNLITFCENGMVKDKYYRYLASAIKFYEVELSKSQKKESEAPKNFVGTLGEKHIFNGTLKHYTNYQTDYGTTHLYVFNDDQGNDIIWKSSNIAQLEIGEAYKITATISKHQVYKDQIQTTITRPKYEPLKDILTDDLIQSTKIIADRIGDFKGNEVVTKYSEFYEASNKTEPDIFNKNWSGMGNLSVYFAHNMNDGISKTINNMNTHQILLLATAIQESGYSVYNSTEYTKKYFKNNKATIEKIDNLYKEIKTRKTAPNTKISIEYKDHLGTIQKKSFKTKHEAQARYDYLTELENKTIQFAPTDSGNARFNYETERATIAQALNLNDPKQETPTEAIMTDTENSINNYHAVYDKATGKVLDVFAGSYKAQEFANGFKGTAASTYISTEIYDAFHNGETIIRQESGVMEIQEKQSDLLGRTVAFKGTELGIIKEVKNGPVGWSLTDKTRIVLDNGHSIRYPFEDESGYEVLPVITLDPATIKYMEDRQKHNDQAEEHNRLRRVGQEALPGIRFQDAAEVGRVWEAKQKGELTDAQWNEYTADLISSNKVTIMTRADYEAKPPFDDEYTGPRYKYGMRNRPYGFATAPKGAILMTYKPEDKELGSRHGTIEYPFELTKDDVQSFELVDFQHATRMEALYHSTVLHYETEMQRRGFTTTFGEHEQSMIATLDLPATETLPERTFSTRIFQDDQGYHVDLNKDSIGRSIELVYDTPEQIDIPRALNWIDSKLAEHMLDYDSTKNMYIIPPELAALNTNDPDFAQHVMEMDEGHVVTYSPKESVLNIDASAKAQGLEVEWRNIEDGDYGPAIAALMTHNSTGDIAEAHIYADGKAMFFLNGERYRGDYYYATSDDETQTAAIKELSNTLKYTPEFTYHIIPGMDDHLVKMKKSGRSIGHVQAGKLAEFESGDFRVFKPFQNWKMTYSKKLQDYLNLNENTVAIGETKVSIKINNILYEDGLSNINLNQTERKIFKALDNAIIQQINYSKSTENLDSFTKAQLERLQKYGADENIKEVAKRLLENPVIEVNATLSNKPTVTVDSGTAIIETDKLKSLAFTLAQHTDEPLSYKELSTATGLTNADIDKNWTLANKIADAALKDSNGRDLVYQIDRHTHMELTGPLSVIYSQSESDIKEEPMFYSKAIGWSKYGDETTTFTNEELKTFSVSDITCSKSDALTMKLDDAFKLVESDKENTKHQGTYIKGQIILNHAHALKETSEMRLKNTMYDPALEQHKITQAEYIITNINRHELKNEVFKLDLDAAMGGNPLAHDHEERRKSIIEQIDNYAINRKTNPERSPYLNPTTPKQEDLKMENSQETVSAQTEYKITGAKLAEKFDYLMKAQTKNLNFLENHLERIRTMPDVVEQPNKRTGEVFTATKAQVLAQMARTEAINSMTDNKYIFNIKEMKKINSKIASGEISSEDVKIHAKMNDVKDKLASGEITKEAAAEAQAGYVPNPELVKYDKYKAQNARFNKETNHPEKKALFAVEFKKAFAEHCEEAGIKNKIEETKTNLENTAYLLSKVKALPDQEFTIRIKEQRKLPNLANDVNFGKQLETALAAHAPAPAPEKKPKARKH